MQNKTLKFRLIILFLISSFFLTSCGQKLFKSDARKVSPNVEDRVKKNIEEGRGFRIGKLGGSGTNFEFASSNELWRASLEVLDFLPLSNVDYSGGVIITEWYNEGTASNEAIKITIRFLSNEIRADGLDIVVHKRICTNSTLNCKVTKYSSVLENELKLAILKKATLLKKNSTDEYKKAYRKKYGDRNIFKD